MPALNFQKQFVQKILNGEKRQTIRSRKKPIKVGDHLYLYTGQRTKLCTKIAEAYCIETHQIVIRQCTLTEKLDVQIADYKLSDQMIDELAIADGFESTKNFVGFFLHSSKASQMMRVISWAGQIIKWGELCQ